MKKNNLFLQQVSVLMILTMAFMVSCNSGTKSNKTDATEDTEVEAVADFQISLAQWSLHRTYFGEG
ncbi:MAG: sugar phosphate isomerase/epimerase, partial [Bacteroidota bacterium]